MPTSRGSTSDDRFVFWGRLVALTVGAAVSLGCVGVDDESGEDVGQVEERLFNRDVSPLAGDQTVRVQRLAYRCGFLNLGICDNTTETFGTGVEKLRAIPGSDKEDIFVAFPNLPAT